MSLAEIKTKIEADARAEAQAILDKARDQADRIRAEVDEQILKIEKTYGDRFAKEQPEILRRREIVAGLDVKKNELGVKQKAISNSFDGAVEQLKALPSEKAAAFFIWTLPNRPCPTVLVVNGGQDGLSQTLYLQKWPKSVVESGVRVRQRKSQRSMFPMVLPMFPLVHRNPAAAAIP